MEERIQINGVWYVKEQPDAKLEPQSVDVTHTQSIIYEDQDYCFEATITIDPETGQPLYDEIGMDVKVTDKTNGKPWIELYWDHGGFFRGCYERNPESIESLKQSLNDAGVENFIAFLQHTMDAGWLYHTAYTQLKKQK
jgi:hypothetical protein